MIKVYGKTNCPSCNKAKALLEQMNIPYQYIDIFQDDIAMEFITASGFKTVPQIFNESELIGDYNALNEHFLLLG